MRELLEKKEARMIHFFGARCVFGDFITDDSISILLIPSKSICIDNMGISWSSILECNSSGFTFTTTLSKNPLFSLIDFALPFEERSFDDKQVRYLFQRVSPFPASPFYWSLVGNYQLNEDA